MLGRMVVLISLVLYKYTEVKASLEAQLLFWTPLDIMFSCIAFARIGGKIINIKYQSCRVEGTPPMYERGLGKYKIYISRDSFTPIHQNVKNSLTNCPHLPRPLYVSIFCVTCENVYTEYEYCRKEYIDIPPVSKYTRIFHNSLQILQDRGPRPNNNGNIINYVPSTIPWLHSDYYAFSMA